LSTKFYEGVAALKRLRTGPLAWSKRSVNNRGERKKEEKKRAAPAALFAWLFGKMTKKALFSDKAPPAFRSISSAEFLAQGKLGRCSLPTQRREKKRVRTSAKYGAASGLGRATL